MSYASSIANGLPPGYTVQPMSRGEFQLPLNNARVPNSLRSDSYQNNNLNFEAIAYTRVPASHPDFNWEWAPSNQPSPQPIHSRTLSRSLPSSPANPQPLQSSPQNVRRTYISQGQQTSREPANPLSSNLPSWFSLAAAPLQRTASAPSLSYFLPQTGSDNLYSAAPPVRSPTPMGPALHNGSNYSTLQSPSLNRQSASSYFSTQRAGTMPTPMVLVGSNSEARSVQYLRGAILLQEPLPSISPKRINLIPLFL
jgi:hypothetical protein